MPKAKDAMSPSDPSSAVPVTSYVMGERQDVRYRSQDGEGDPGNPGEVEKGAAGSGQDSTPQGNADAGDNVNSDAQGTPEGSAEDLEKKVETTKAENEASQQKLDAAAAAGDEGIAELESLQQAIVKTRTDMDNAIGIEKAKQATLLQSLRNGEMDTADYVAEKSLIDDEIQRIRDQYTAELVEHQSAYKFEEHRQNSMVQRVRNEFLAETKFKEVYEDQKFQAFMNNPRTKALGLGPAGSYYAFEAQRLAGEKANLEATIKQLQEEKRSSVEEASRGKDAAHRKVANSAGMSVNIPPSGPRTPQNVEDSMLAAFQRAGA